MENRGWALQGGAGTLGLGSRDSAVGRSRETLGLGTPGRHWVWALRDTPGEEKS